MARINLINGMTGVSFRTGINDNFLEIYNKLSASQIKSIYESNADTNEFTDAEKAAVATIGNNINSINLVPQITAPTYLEGNMFYNKNSGSLEIQGGYSDITLKVGREIHIEVFNDSGSTISKGKVVRHNGVNIGFPKIELAKADTFVNSIILGVTTHDIPNGQKGIITTFGVVNGIDTSSLNLNIPIYLSETIAGELTNVAPSFISQVGSLLTKSIDGDFFVSISNNINLPIIGAFFQNYTTTLNITDTAQEFNNFATTKSTLIDVSSGNSFKVPFNGVYTCNFTISLSNIISNVNGSIIPIELYNKTTSTVLFTYNFLVGRNDIVGSSSFSAPIELFTNDELVIRYRSNDNPGSDIVVDGISVSIESRHLELN